MEITINLTNQEILFNPNIIDDVKTLGQTFEGVKFNFKQPAQLTATEIANVLEQAENLEKWCAMVKEYALDQAVNNGAKYPGYKVVEGRSNRTWAADETLIAAQLIEKGYRDDDIWPRKLKGISVLEQFLSKKAFDDILGNLVVKPKGKPTLVHLEDKRLEMDLTPRKKPRKSRKKLKGEL
ncbi:MAG: DUF2800 domain-containing protein [Anaerotignaceae bacterium]